MKAVGLLIALTLVSTQVVAFELSDLDPTYKKSAIRRGLRSIDPTKPDSPSRITDNYLNQRPPAPLPDPIGRTRELEQQRKVQELQTEVEQLRLEARQRAAAQRQAQAQQAIQAQIKQEETKRAEAERQAKLKQEETRKQEEARKQEETEQLAQRKREDEERTAQRGQAQQQRLNEQQRKHELEMKKIEAIGSLFKALSDANKNRPPPTSPY